MKWRRFRRYKSHCLRHWWIDSAISHQTASVCVTSSIFSINLLSPIKCSCYEGFFNLCLLCYYYFFSFFFDGKDSEHCKHLVKVEILCSDCAGPQCGPWISQWIWGTGSWRQALSPRCTDRATWFILDPSVCVCVWNIWNGVFLGGALVDSDGLDGKPKQAKRSRMGVLQSELQTTMAWTSLIQIVSNRSKYLVLALYKIAADNLFKPHQSLVSCRWKKNIKMKRRSTESSSDVPYLFAQKNFKAGPVLKAFNFSLVLSQPVWNLFIYFFGTGYLHYISGQPRAGF